MNASIFTNVKQYAILTVLKEADFRKTKLDIFMKQIRLRWKMMNRYMWMILLKQ